MAKSIFLATAADGTEFKRTSDNRAYTHTVISKRNFNRDLDDAGKISATDASNFKFYTGIVERGYVSCSPSDVGKYAWLTAEQQAADAIASVANALEQLAGAKTATEYQFAKRDERVAKVLAARDAGAYDVWHNAGWCGRLDLAQKLAAQQAKYGLLEITILEAVKIR